MGFFDKALNIGKCVMERANEQAEREKKRAQISANRAYYDAKKMSSSELREAIKSTDDTYRKYGYMKEANERKNSR